MLANLGAFGDRAHYSYDTRDTDDAWYARDAVGLYVRPDLASEAYAPQRRASLQRLLAPFLPVPVRAVVILEPPRLDEHVYTYDDPHAPSVRKIGEERQETLAAAADEDCFGLTDAYHDGIPGWVWLHAQDFDDLSAYPDHRAVDFAAEPIVTRYRAWHSGLSEVH